MLNELAPAIGCGRPTRVHWLPLLIALALISMAIAFFARTGLGIADECPSESLRWALNSSSLPECRAYELVTPPYKEGYPLFVRSYSANGENAILETLGTLSGNPGSGQSNPEAALYLARRTDAGWQLSPLNPPIPDFVGQIPLASEAGTGDTLWEQHTPQQSLSTRGLYVRDFAGAFSLIGLLAPHPESPAEQPSNIIEGNLQNVVRVVGATGNFQHVVLEAVDPSAQWPFDETVLTSEHHSLYEYSDVNNATPTLVGVTGEKGSTQLIATCGTTMGSGLSGSRYNALSNDGETIFFTVNPCGEAPSATELYSRIHGSVRSTEPAETVHISASACTSACGKVESGKNFEGASENGRRVFFTSTQKLTNDALDGTASGDAASRSGCPELPVTPEPEMAGCNLYVYDFSASPQERLKVLSSGGAVLGVLGIAEDGSRVYYVASAADPSAARNVYNISPKPEQPNLYAYDVNSGATTFIATLSSEDGSDWSRLFSRSAEVGGETGRFLLFLSSSEAMTPDDTGTIAQLYEYRAAGEGEPAELVRITKGEDGFNGDGNDVIAGIESSTIKSVAEQLGHNIDLKSTSNRLNVAQNGRTVFFISTGQLSPRATSSNQTPACRSLYEFHSLTALAEGEVHIVSDGRDTQLFKGAICGPKFEGMDISGDNVLFSASDALLSGDVDGGQQDIYDARVDGGFGPALTAGACSPESCEGASSSARSPLVPGAAATGVASVSSSGLGDRAVQEATTRRATVGHAGAACTHKQHKRRSRCRRARHVRLLSRSKRLHIRKGSR